MKYQRIVIKIGSNLLTQNNNKLDLNHLGHLVEQLFVLYSWGLDILVVTSVAIVCCAEKIGIKPITIQQKQAAAAVGQILLMDEYKRFFGYKGVTIAQILLTRDGLVGNKTRRVHAKNTLQTLLSERVVPIINENDSVVIDEIKFGDNDTLSAQVAIMLKAELLVILTDIDGLYAQDPQKNSQTPLIPLVTEVTEEILAGCSQISSSAKGTGGMYSKVCAAKEAMLQGVEVIIANGYRENVLDAIFRGDKIGTRFCSKKINKLTN